MPPQLTAIMNVTGLPVILAVDFAKRENQDFDLVGLIGTPQMDPNPHEFISHAVPVGRQFI